MRQALHLGDLGKRVAGGGGQPHQLGRRKFLERVVLAQARALENQVVWVSAKPERRVRPAPIPGKAKVVDPGGRVLASTGTREGAAVARIVARCAVSATRDELSYIGDRRPRPYGIRSARVAT